MPPQLRALCVQSSKLQREDCGANRSAKGSQNKGLQGLKVLGEIFQLLESLKRPLIERKGHCVAFILWPVRPRFPHISCSGISGMRPPPPHGSCSSCRQHQLCYTTAREYYVVSKAKLMVLPVPGNTIGNTGFSRNSVSQMFIPTFSPQQSVVIKWYLISYQMSNTLISLPMSNAAASVTFAFSGFLMSVNSKFQFF